MRAAYRPRGTWLNYWPDRGKQQDGDCRANSAYQLAHRHDWQSFRQPDEASDDRNDHHADQIAEGQMLGVKPTWLRALANNSQQLKQGAVRQFSRQETSPGAHVRSIHNWDQRPSRHCQRPREFYHFAPLPAESFCHFVC